jgi:FtsH-binding integral membrane protein
MAFAQAARSRVIPGAVATVGVSDRVTFLRKTYAHLGGALIAFAALTWAMMTYATEFSLRFTAWSWSGWNFLFVFLLFIGAGVLAQRLAMHETSRGLQYLGLGIEVAAFSFMLQPLLWIVMQKFGGAVVIGKGGVIYPHLSATAASVIGQSVVITLAIFIGLTATVFVTRKDFTFLRGILSVSMFAVIGVIIASLIFGFSLGALFSGFIILLMAGYILHQTSLVMSYFPPTAHVAAALMLFATVAVLFMHVLRVMAILRGGDR